MVPNLKLLHLFSAGVDHWAGHPIFDDDDGKEKEKERITITTSSGVSSVPIAEWVVMTSLVVTKRFGVTYEWQREREWGGNEGHLREGRDWVGRTVGVLGYGSIGRQGGFFLFSCWVLVFGSLLLGFCSNVCPRPFPMGSWCGGYFVGVGVGVGDAEADGNGDAIVL